MRMRKINSMVFVFFSVFRHSTIKFLYVMFEYLLKIYSFFGVVICFDLVKTHTRPAAH
jgi:hypothetical protein